MYNTHTYKSREKNCAYLFYSINIVQLKFQWIELGSEDETIDVAHNSLYALHTNRFSLKLLGYLPTIER